MLQLVRKGQQTRGVKSTTIDNNSVICRAVSNHDSLDPKTERGLITTTTFDFGTVPLERIYLAAAEYCLIAWRRDFKKSDDPEIETFTHSAQDFLPNVKLSQLELAKKIMKQSLTKDQILALLAEMNEEQETIEE